MFLKKFVERQLVGKPSLVPFLAWTVMLFTLGGLVNQTQEALISAETEVAEKLISVPKPAGEWPENYQKATVTGEEIANWQESYHETPKRIEIESKIQDMNYRELIDSEYFWNTRNAPNSLYRPQMLDFKDALLKSLEFLQNSLSEAKIQLNHKKIDLMFQRSYHELIRQRTFSELMLKPSETKELLRQLVETVDSPIEKEWNELLRSTKSHSSESAINPPMSSFERPASNISPPSFNERKEFLKNAKKADLQPLEKIVVFQLHEYQKEGLQLLEDEEIFLSDLKKGKAINHQTKQYILQKIRGYSSYSRSKTLLTGIMHKNKNLVDSALQRLQNALETLHNDRFFWGKRWDIQEKKLLRFLKENPFQEMSSADNLLLEELATKKVTTDISSRLKKHSIFEHARGKYTENDSFHNAWESLDHGSKYKNALNYYQDKKEDTSYCDRELKFVDELSKAQFRAWNEFRAILELDAPFGSLDIGDVGVIFNLKEDELQELRNLVIKKNTPDFDSHRVYSILSQADKRCKIDQNYDMAEKLGQLIKVLTTLNLETNTLVSKIEQETNAISKANIAFLEFRNKKLGSTIVDDFDHGMEHQIRTDIFYGLKFFQSQEDG